jgi:hypothetical protein
MIDWLIDPTCYAGLIYEQRIDRTSNTTLLILTSKHKQGSDCNDERKQVDLALRMGYLAQVYFLQDRAVVAKARVR